MLAQHATNNDSWSQWTIALLQFDRNRESEIQTQLLHQIEPETEMFMYWKKCVYTLLDFGWRHLRVRCQIRGNNSQQQLEIKTSGHNQSNKALMQCRVTLPTPHLRIESESRGVRAHVGDELFHLLRARSRLIRQKEGRDEIEIVLTETLLCACIQEHTYSEDSRRVLADGAAATCDLDAQFSISLDLLHSLWRIEVKDLVN